MSKDAKGKAKGLLKNPGTHHQVLCHCLDVLGEDAEAEAEELLANPDTHHEVLCRCLDLLGEDAKHFATERIRRWAEIGPASLLVHCLQVAGATVEAQRATEEILDAWDEAVPTSVRAAALRARFDTQLRTQRAFEVLNNWHRQHRSLVAAALAVFWNEPNIVTGYCRDIIGRWHKEILYRRMHRRAEYDGHIMKALSHPALRKEARKAVQEMVAFEKKEPGFLGTRLRQWAEEIMQEQWPSWSLSEEEIG